MNLGVLKETRQVGDIFVMQPPDGSFLYGPVIDISAAIGPMKGCILIYVYRARSSEKVPIPELLRGQLLVPPMMTNRLAWTEGYFELIENRPLRQSASMGFRATAQSTTASRRLSASRRPPMTEYSGTDPHHPGAGLCPVRTATHEAAGL